MDFDRTAFISALQTRFNMAPEDSEHIAGIVEDCFFADNEVNDEDLDKETRSLFYTLESEGIMTFRRTEYRFEGALRRAFFWRLTDEALTRTLERDVRKDPSEEEEIQSLYATLHDDVWNRQNAVTA